MKVVIVDDEPKAIELLKSYLEHFNDFETIGTFRNGLKAFEFLHENPVDLIFLDINMPHIDGLSLAKLIDAKTKIVFTTAYSEFAVESYEVKATDYLLKPISLDRFTQSISKFIEQKNQPTQQHQAMVLVKSGATTHRINTDHIHFIKKDGNYALYHLPDKTIMARESVAEALAKLPTNFIQVHRSYLVNLDQVTCFEIDTLRVLDEEITIGETYRKQTMDKLLHQT
ncbi:LytR/AlgR family response regulator transcription factor [Marinicella meishanensis]|uniref:LytR/AlgR family response regulator transcription factor n=1 Tax=Marinicella meishanensis TaxID=2873263 RepID=UPI001CBC154F|nr:response regulator transcription factor [Marinicella sp. NBU2979]